MPHTLRTVMKLCNMTSAFAVFAVVCTLTFAKMLAYLHTSPTHTRTFISSVSPQSGVLEAELTELANISKNTIGNSGKVEGLVSNLSHFQINTLKQHTTTQHHSPYTVLDEKTVLLIPFSIEAFMLSTANTHDEHTPYR